MAEPFTPEWNEMRTKVFADMARSQRQHGVVWTDEQRRKSKLASDLSVLRPGDISYEQAREAYERG